MSSFKFYRRWRGGIWERWIMEDTMGDCWFRVSPERRWPAYRPSPLCRGTPLVEDYTKEAT